MLPVTILTGFLGAGKTTLLNRLLRENAGLRIAALVNDFGAINIDAELIVGVSGETISLQNGCICCTIRDDLLNAARELLARAQAFDHIVVETSGVSDPFAVAQTFMHPALRDAMTVDAIITVVDAEQVQTLSGENFVLAMEQITAADLVLLNKIDVLDEAARESARTFVLGLEPAARIIETVQARVPPEMLLSINAFDPARLNARPPRDVHTHAAGAHADHDHDHALVFATHHVESNMRWNRLAVRRAVERLPLGIYRAKGMLHLGDSPQHASVLHVVGKRASLTPGAAWGERAPHNQLVFIGAQDGFDPAAIDALFSGCADDGVGQAGDIIDQSFEWVRAALKTGLQSDA